MKINGDFIEDVNNFIVNNCFIWQAIRNAGDFIGEHAWSINAIYERVSKNAGDVISR